MAAGGSESDSIFVSFDNLTNNKSGSFLGSGNEQVAKNSLQNKWCVERSNLLNIAKICIKSLIDCSLSTGTGRTLTDEFPQLDQFFIVFEHIIRHGMKDKRSLLGQRKGFLGVLESLEDKIPSLVDILLNIKHLSDIKTNLGKTRAWMRLALMQKILAEQMFLIVEEKYLLKEWYEDHSILLSEEGSVISGMLVGLNVIDCNFDLKGIDIDEQHSIIDISLYLRDGNYLEKNDEDKREQTKEELKIEMILDQNAYLEQINKSLSTCVNDLKNESKALIGQNTEYATEIETLRNKMVSLVAEREKYKKEYEKLLDQHNQRLQSASDDLNVERETYEQSRSGLNEIYLKSQQELEKITLEKKELQILLEDQTAMNQEKVIAMQLLEKDIHDKQETLISLRRQLEDVKKINLEMHKKWQHSESSLKKHESEWSSLESKCTRMFSQTKEMEKNLDAAENAKKVAEVTGHQMAVKLAQVQAEKHAIETDIKIEREWRAGLQEEVDSQKHQIEKMNVELKLSQDLSKKTQQLKEQLERSERCCAEQELTLEDMGRKLNLTHTQVDEMRELHAAIKDKSWKEDKEATECQLCIQSFSLSKRKHHCRSCGGIFCNSCSDNQMPLPSSAKPVRVCDTCYETLLTRYSTNK